MKKGKIKNILRTLILSLMIAVPSFVFASTNYSNGDIRNANQIVGDTNKQGNVEFSKLVERDGDSFKVTLSVEGEDVTEDANRPVYVAIVFDRSGSMCSSLLCITTYGTKWNNAVSGAKQAASKILEEDMLPNAKIGLVTFSDSAEVSREFLNEDLEEADFSVPYGGTNIASGLDSAYNMLNAETIEKNAKKYVILIGDGRPEVTLDYEKDKKDTIEKANELKVSGIDIFSIGYSGDLSDLDQEAENVLKSIASKESYYVKSDSDSIIENLSNVANKLKTFEAGTNAVITDTIKAPFTFVEGSLVNATISGNVVTCAIGDIEKSAKTCSFNIKIDNDIVEDGWYKTNDVTNEGVKLTYKDYKNISSKKVIEESAEVYVVQNEYNYTINYYKDSGSEIIYLDKVKDKANLNDKIIIDTEKFLPDGYKFEGSIPSLTINKEGNVFDVIYVRDDSQTKEISYKVEYYKDDVLVYTKNESKTVWAGYETLSIDSSLIAPANKYTGYKLSYTDPETIPNEVKDKDIIKVYYVRDDLQTKEISYKIEYYKDDVLVDTKNESETVWAGYETLSIDSSLIAPVNKYTGYKLSYTDPETIPNEVENGDIIKVYYVKDINQTKTLNYTVKFYIDNEEVIEDRIEKPKIVWINDSNNINVESIDMSDDKYTGYKLITDPSTIPTSVVTGTTINVYYEKDETQTKELSYTVKYFKDGKEVEEDEIVVTKEVWVNDSDLIDVDFELINVTNKYVGYSFTHINPERFNEEVQTGTIIKIYYEINYYDYQVNYYKDSISEDNLIDSINDEAKYGEIIEIEELLNLPKGYTYNGDQVELTIDIENNIFNIVYEKKSFEYTVEYYYDGKLDEEKTEVISALYGTEITEVEDKSYDNYLLSKIENLPLVIDTEDNIIKVYYVESGIGGDIIEPPKTGNNSYLNILLVLISLLIIKLK